MQKLFFRPENAWVGDLIPYYEDGVYYAFYLHDPRMKEDIFAEETTWHLVTTRDFEELKYHGEAIARGNEQQPDFNCYTGSVVKDEKGTYHAFFTAYNEKFKIDGKVIQSVMRASGPDLYHLATDREFLFTADDRIYESFDWRDPFVFYHEEEKCWWMILAARKRASGAHRGGCLALCKSEDLVHWSYEKPFFDPGMYITMECPEVFRMGKYWYLVFSTFSDRFVTHYRIADRLEGPWRIPEIDTFDCRADYAIKTASDGKRRVAFGWIASKKGNSDFGSWEWGGTMVLHEVVQNSETGELTVSPLERMKEFYKKDWNTGDFSCWQCEFDPESGKMEARSMGAVLFRVPEDCFSLDLDFSLEGASEFGVALHVTEGLETGYYLRMDAKTGTMAMDIWPRAEQGRYQWQIHGDVACQIETLRPLPAGPDYHVRIFREEDICVIYVNDKVVLSTRTYDHKGNLAGLYLTQGRGILKGISVKTK